MIGVSEYTRFFEDHCLQLYILDGGATVKFCIGDDADLETLLVSMETTASNLKMVLAPIDASRIKVQMIDQLFFGVARGIDWNTLSRTIVNRVCGSAGFPIPNEHPKAALTDLAEIYSCDPRELQRDINREFQKVIFKDHNMVQDFRIAMLRLCQYEFRTGQVSDVEAEAINQWLVGELKQVSLLRSARIFRKVDRTNARGMLFSLVRWINKGGYSGLLVTLDLRQFFKPRVVGTDDLPILYSRAAVIDAYESLRQLIDNTDEFKNMATVVCLPPEFLNDRMRGVDAYQALKLRIYDEVRDQSRDNPFGSLVRLGASSDLGSHLARTEKGDDNGC